MITTQNKEWEESHPIVTIITAVFNRRLLLPRALNSVKKQTFRNFEYIIINDGSIEPLDDIIVDFMATSHIPTMYINKEHEGVHIARNMGFKNARGKYLLTLDSDDELLPHALQSFINAWDTIPESEQNNYREVVALCCNKAFEQIGHSFPSNANSVSKEMAILISKSTKGEHISMKLTKTMQENLFPTPQGVTFVPEGLLWNYLDKKYKKYFINECLRIYHNDAIDSFHNNHDKTKNAQFYINSLWANKYYLENWNLYKYTEIRFLSLFHNLSRKSKICAIYCLSSIILKLNKCYPTYNWAKEKHIALFDRLFICCIYIPLLFIILLRKKHRLLNL